MNLYIAEKPSVIQSILESDEIIKNKNDEHIFTSHNSFLYKFSYKKFKFYSSPEYNFIKPMYSIVKVKYQQEIPTNKKFSPDSFLNEYDIKAFKEIIFAVDPDHAGIRAADLLIEHFNLKNDSRIFFYDIYRDKTLKPYFNNDFISSCRNIYLKKDYVDYNFNSIIKTNHDDFDFITRNMLWTLLLISNYNAPKTKAYDLLYKACIGSAASQATILDTLKNNDFLDRDHGTTGKTSLLFDILNIKKDSIYEFLDIQHAIKSDSLFDDSFIKKTHSFLENTIIS